MLYLILSIIALLGLIIATIVDIKIKEIPDVITYSLVFLGLSIRGIYAIAEKDAKIFTIALIYFLIFFALANILYYTKQWGGGDSKLLIGIAVLFATAPFETKIPFVLVIFMNILIVGLLYNLFGAGYLIVKNWKKFILKFKIINKEIKKQKYYTFILAIIVFLLQFFLDDAILKIMFNAIALFSLISSYAWAILKSVEECCMIKDIPVKNLREGDWIIKDIFIKGKKIYNCKSIGVERKQIDLLLKAKIKKVTIKEGFAFAPAFLLGVIISLIFKEVILFRLINLI